MNRILIFWSWNYKMDENTVTRCLDDFKKVGIEGFFIHARAGLMTEYFGEEWFDIIRFTAKEAAKRGLDVYLYDENGWPSGFADGKIPALGKNYQQTYLVKTSLKGDKIRDKEIAAIFYLDKPCNLSDVKENRKYTVFEVRRNTAYTDLLSEEAIGKFIEYTHEVYKSKLGDLFGKEIKGIFTDEPQLALIGYPYSHDLFATFKKEYGYSLKEQIINIDKPGYEELRYDYREHIHKRYTRAFFAQIGKWCESNGLIFTGHSAAEDGLYSQFQTQCDVMTSYEYFQMPGIDFLMNRYAPITLVKQLTSVANQLGKENVLSETFGGSGHAAMPKELLSKWFYQCMHGINVACMHLSSTSQVGRRKRDYPPTFSYHLNWFDELGSFIGAMKKIAEHAVGEVGADVLVVNPITSYFTQYYYRDDGNIDPRLSAISTHYRVLLENLSFSGIGFDIGDEFVMKKHASVDGGKIFVGKKGYRAIIIPDCDNLNESTVDIIEKAIEEGVKVFVTETAPKTIGAKRNEKIARLYYGGVITGLPIRRSLVKMRLLENGISPEVMLYTENGKAAEGVLVSVIKSFMSDSVFVFNTLSEKRRLIAEYEGKKFELDLRGESGAIIDVAEKTAYYPLEGKTVPAVFDKEIKRTVIETVFKEQITENVAVIDRCRVKIGEDVVAEGNTLFCNEKIFNLLPKNKKTGVSVEYEIRSSIEKRVKVVIEKSPDITDIIINDKRCFFDDDWFYDREFKTLDVKLVNGLNKIVISYFLEGDVSDDSVFETERNKYFRSTEIENVYVLGDVRLVSGTIEKKSRQGKNYFVFEDYAIGAGGGKVLAEDRPFFRGRIYAETYFKYTPNENARVYLEIKNSFPACKIYVNKKYAGTSFGGAVEITDLIKSGKNKLTAEFVSSDRNLMGPHHYTGIDSEFIGPDVYACQKDNCLRFDLETPYKTLPKFCYTEKYNCLAEEYEKELIITEKINRK